MPILRDPFTARFSAGAGRPAPGAPIDLRHPMADGLAAAYLLNEGRGNLLVREQTRLGLAGDGVIELPNLDALHGLNGEGYFNRNGGLSRRVNVSASSALSDTARGAVVALCRWDGDQSGGGNPFGVVWYRDDVYTKFLTLSDPDPSIGCLEWRWSDPNNGDIVGTTPVGDGRWRLAIASFKSGNHELYLDGQLEGTFAATDPTDPGPVPVHFPSTFAGTLALLMEFRRPLSTEEIGQLVLDPYLLWRPRAGRTYSYVTTLNVTSVDRGTAQVLNGYAGLERGLFASALDRFAADDRGLYYPLAGPFEAGADRGLGAVLNSLAGTDLGDARLALEAGFVGVDRGVGRILNGYEETDRGDARLALEAFGGTDRGTAAVWLALSGTDRGRSAVFIAIAGADRGKGRVANDALERYELYRGVDAEPDFTAAPWQTFTSLPYTTPALAGYPATFYFTLRRRNRYGLISQNVASWSVELDASGAVVAPPPSAPINAAAQAVGTNNVRVTAQYGYRADAAAQQADTWLVYVRTNGTDPDPSIDSPVATPAIVKRDGTAILAYDHGGSFPVRAVVRVRRSGTPNVDSASSAVVSAIPLPVTAAVVSRPDAHLGYGDKQQQDSSIS